MFCLLIKVLRLFVQFSWEGTKHITILCVYVNQSVLEWGWMRRPVLWIYVNKLTLMKFDWKDLCWFGVLRGLEWFANSENHSRGKPQRRDALVLLFNTYFVNFSVWGNSQRIQIGEIHLENRLWIPSQLLKNGKYKCSGSKTSWSIGNVWGPVYITVHPNHQSQKFFQLGLARWHKLLQHASKETSVNETHLKKNLNERSS